MSSRRTSGSLRSPSAVEPTRSQKTTVTTLRTPADVSEERAAPQAPQNRETAGFSWPQAPQITREASPRAPADSNPYVSRTRVEVRGIEPLSLGDRPGLLRAQPVGRSRLEAPTGGAPLGQPGFDVRRRPPSGTVPVSLLTTPDPRSPATRGGRLPSYLGSERVFSIGACVCPGFSRGIRGPRPASPERYPLKSKPVHPHMRLSSEYTLRLRQADRPRRAASRSSS